MVSRQEIFLGYPHHDKVVFHIWKEVKYLKKRNEILDSRNQNKIINICGKIQVMKQKGTYQPKKGKRLKVHGFLARMATALGRKIIKKRRAKGRKNLTISSQK